MHQVRVFSFIPIIREAQEILHPESTQIASFHVYKRFLNSSQLAQQFVTPGTTSTPRPLVENFLFWYIKLSWFFNQTGGICDKKKLLIFHSRPINLGISKNACLSNDLRSKNFFFSLLCPATDEVEFAKIFLRAEYLRNVLVA